MKPTSATGTSESDADWQCDPIIVPGVSGPEPEIVWARALEEVAVHAVGQVGVPVSDDDLAFMEFVEGSGLVAGERDAGASAGYRALARELRRRGLSAIDLRPPHTETGLAAHALSGQPSTLPVGLGPEAVARRIVEAIEVDERDVPGSAFS